MVKSEHKIKTEPSKAMKSLSSSSSSGAASDIKKKKYKGVRIRSWGSWVSEIRAPNQKTRIWLGSYSTPEAAARAYDAALLCLKGSSANLNFPLSSSQYIPQDTSAVMSPKSIQRVAAAAAANAFIDNANTPPSPPLASTSSSSLVSSPSVASSPSDQIDDDASLMSSSFEAQDQANESMAVMEPWYNTFDDGLLHSPKYLDHMLSGAFFDVDSSHLLDDLYEESDIRLWSFC
ncbi:hypothetical protein RJT34_09790 [Clitoria ternatea]|uniref:AP2/ERF domain-containing protein n=1 Tax=Clitoria ternatea TaxID=43366 RepID=A0AAN9K984_CLITE